jgi:3-oxoacyl-[acyl-carrier-protein] synthase-1
MKDEDKAKCGAYMTDLAITCVNAITAVGHDAAMTAAAVRAGISRFAEYEDYPDGGDNPVTVSRIRGIEDGREAVARMGATAALCLENLLEEYFQNSTLLPPQIHLFLGVASVERPGPRYEESCMWSLPGILKKWANMSSIETVPLGNASMQNAVAPAGELVKSNANALCIIGGIDSLLRNSTLNWFEQDCRLKSVSYGRHQGLIAGEAVCFMIVEDPERARQANWPVMARISGLGLADEPAPRADGTSSRGTGLTEACRTALAGTSNGDVCAVFGDLNGENSRALEWCRTEKRCFKKTDTHRQLWTPANCYGDIGAASGAVLTAVAAQGFVRGWLPGPVLVSCSDDHGPCGALVLEKWMP